MKVLVLGGTLFLGRHVVETARALGHEVATFNRGVTAPDVDANAPDVDALRGDREGDLSAISGRAFDVVIDTNGYLPRVVERTAGVLRCERYVFVSSLSVYADRLAGATEDAPLAALDDPASEDVDAHYGGLKVACERAVEAAFPGRAIHARLGVTIGPHDRVDRFPYWVQRVAEGGEVLAPGTPDAPLQLVDARDAAAWMLRAAEAGATGPFNVIGPAAPLAWGGFLDELAAVASGPALRFTWVDDACLAAEGVKLYSGVPLWLPAEYAALHRTPIDRARAAGLTFRPIAESARDTLATIARDGYRTDRMFGPKLERGPTRERERELLDAFARRRAAIL